MGWVYENDRGTWISFWEFKVVPVMADMNSVSSLSESVCLVFGLQALIGKPGGRYILLDLRCVKVEQNVG